MKSVHIFYIAFISVMMLYASAAAQSPTNAKELPLPDVPVSLTQPADRADFIIYHFWNGLDFSDPASSLDDTSLEQNFVNYINLFSHSHPEKLPESIANLLNQAEKDPSTAKRLYVLADKYLNSKDSPFRNEGFYIHFLENATKSEALGEAGRERAKYRLDAALKNRPGNQAADFKYETRDGKTSSLSDLPSGTKTLLIFYDPDCGHCSETIDALKELKLGEMRVVAIDPQEDKMIWDATKSGLPENWTVGFALDPIQDEETYIFEEMPTMYILDEDNKILLKDATLSEIKELLKPKD